jgi:hypothetical protein
MVVQPSPPSIFRAETLPIEPQIPNHSVTGKLHPTSCLYEFDYSVPHLSGFRQYLSLCDWLISLSIMSSEFLHVVACVRISFLFKAEWYSCSLLRPSLGPYGVSEIVEFPILCWQPNLRCHQIGLPGFPLSALCPLDLYHLSHPVSQISWGTWPAL